MVPLLKRMNTEEGENHTQSKNEPIRTMQAYLVADDDHEGYVWKLPGEDNKPFYMLSSGKVHEQKTLGKLEKGYDYPHYFIEYQLATIICYCNQITLSYNNS